MTESKEKKDTTQSSWVTVILIILVVIVVGMMFLKGISRQTVGGSFGGAGFVNKPARTTAPVYDVEPQIVYRLDEHRYIKLEQYESCDVTVEDLWFAKAYYYDDQRGIKTPISANFRNFKGQLINADPSGKHIAIAVSPSMFAGSDKGQGPHRVAYSTDYGQTFKSFTYTSFNTTRPIIESKKYTVVITEKELAVYKGYGNDYFIRKLDFRSINDLGEFVKTSESRTSLPDYPVLMDKYECDSQIVPREISYIPLAEYKAQQEGE